MRAPPPQKRDSMAGGCLHYQLYEPEPRRRDDVFGASSRSDLENMNKLVARRFYITPFSVITYEIRRRGCVFYRPGPDRTDDVLFLA